MSLSIWARASALKYGGAMVSDNNRGGSIDGLTAIVTELSNG
jgi:hypothetical protein